MTIFKGDETFKIVISRGRTELPMHPNPPSPIKVLFLSHLHVDHCCSLKLFLTPVCLIHFFLNSRTQIFPFYRGFVILVNFQVENNIVDSFSILHLYFQF